MDHRVTVATFSALLLVAACAGENAPDGASPTTASSSAPRTTEAVPVTLPTAPSTTEPNPTDSTPVSDPRPVGGPGRGLTFFGDCPRLLAHLHSEALERVTAWGLDGGWYPYAADGAVRAEGLDAPASTEAPASSDDFAGGGVGPTYSGTNTQEVGVDEGDIVETDGEYVYAVSYEGLRIVDVAAAEVVAEVELPGGEHQLLLDGDRLLVVSQSWNTGDDTVLSLYDVADAASPSLLRRSHLEGRLVGARAVDGVARLVVSSSFGQRLPFVNPAQFGLDEERSLVRNREVIEGSAVEDWLPRSFDEAGDGSFLPIETAIDCGDVGVPDEFSGLGLTWVASVDLQGTAEPVGSTGVVSSGDLVYASPTGLYVATVAWDPVPIDTQRQAAPTTPPTQIHAFSLEAGTDATYVASGEVPGRLLNQFSMSEYEGDLRVATTVDDAGNGESESGVHVLRRNGGSLDVVGSLGGLGRTEQIYAVRFLGTTGYVVTFRQTDPLYVVDLSDPTAPRLGGELKIPGYSAYLHPVGEGLLLGVGQDADADGRTLGTQMSLFDVSDPANPQQVSTLPIGGWSEAEWDHRAFLYWPEDGTVVIPVSPDLGRCPGQSDCLAGQLAGSAGGAVVARVVDRQLVPVGVVGHDGPDDGCWNPLQRSIVIDDELITVGPDQAKISDRASLAERATVRWGDPGEYGCWGYWEG
jgi:Beta propeller domain